MDGERGGGYGWGGGLEILSGFISRGESTRGFVMTEALLMGRGGGRRQKRAELPANVTTPLMQKRTKCRQVLPP